MKGVIASGAPYSFDDPAWVVLSPTVVFADGEQVLTTTDGQPAVARLPVAVRPGDQIAGIAGPAGPSGSLIILGLSSPDMSWVVALIFGFSPPGYFIGIIDQPQNNNAPAWAQTVDGPIAAIGLRAQTDGLEVGAIVNGVFVPQTTYPTTYPSGPLYWTTAFTPTADGSAATCTIADPPDQVYVDLLTSLSDAVLAALQTITAANGYATDVAAGSVLDVMVNANEVAPPGIWFFFDAGDWPGVGNKPSGYRIFRARANVRYAVEARGDAQTQKAAVALRRLQADIVRLFSNNLTTEAIDTAVKTAFPGAAVVRCWPERITANQVNPDNSGLAIGEMQIVAEIHHPYDQF